MLLSESAVGGKVVQTSCSHPDTRSDNLLLSLLGDNNHIRGNKQYKDTDETRPGSGEIEASKKGRNKGNTEACIQKGAGIIEERGTEGRIDVQIYFLLSYLQGYMAQLG